MAISPIAIATEGFLNSPLSVATVGHLTIETGTTPPGGGGGWGAGRRGPYARYKSPIVALDELREQLRNQALREDEEIIAILLAAMRVIQ